MSRPAACRPSTARVPHPGTAVTYPGPNLHGASVKGSRRSPVRPSLTCGPRDDSAALGLSPGLRTRAGRTRARTPGRGQASSTSLELRLRHLPHAGPPTCEFTRTCATFVSRCHWIATIGADWAAAVRDGCHAGLPPLIAVMVKFCSARWPGTGEPAAVIRRRTRSGAGRIAAGLAARRWPADAARLPWVASAYPMGDLAMDAAYREDRPGGCTAARLPGAASARLPASAAGRTTWSAPAGIGNGGGASC